MDEYSLVDEPLSSGSPERRFVVIMLLQVILDARQIAKGNANYFHPGMHKQAEKIETLLKEENSIRKFLCSDQFNFYCQALNLDTPLVAGLVHRLLSGDAIAYFEKHLNAILEQSQFGVRQPKKICQEKKIRRKTCLQLQLT